MKNTSLRVITFGVFDMFHFGHLKLFENIKKYFNNDCFLIVCVQDSKSILKYKPESKVFYSTDERVKILKNIKCVDDVMIYDDVDKDIKEVEFDIWIKGPDQTHQGFVNAQNWCEENNKEVITISRTQGISSTYIKKLAGDLKGQDAKHR